MAAPSHHLALSLLAGIALALPSGAALDLGAQAVDGPVAGGSVDPSAALLDLAARHGVVPTAEQQAALAALPALDAGVHAALAAVVDAFLALEAAAAAGPLLPGDAMPAAH